MKHFCTVIFLSLLLTGIVDAQDFITRGKIEFEVKRNNKRTISATQRANNPFLASLPDFDISYQDLIFSWNQSIYLPGRKRPGEINLHSPGTAYMDLSKQQSIRKTNFYGEEYLVEDSINKVKWKIENETRKIAGWECRKAVGRIYDSVYVVAFYCPEIMPQGGPELFTGLPGMILGLAIPRYFTTWFATKIEIANIDETKIVPPVVKKKKQLSKKEFAEIMLKKIKENGGGKNDTLDSILKILSGYTL